MSLVGELNQFLGLQVKQVDIGIFILKAKFVKNLLKKFDLENIKAVRTPKITSLKIYKDDQGKDVIPKIYSSIIASLFHLTTSRPYITFSVGVCVRYQAKKESYLVAIK